MVLKRLFIFLGASLLLLSACSSISQEITTCSDSLVPIKVDFTWSPSKPAINEQVLLQVTISQDGRSIKKADDVHFEIWKHDNDDYHHIKAANHSNSGVYDLSWSFKDAGMYYVYYHVTACSMHSMEKEMIIVENDKE